MTTPITTRGQGATRSSRGNLSYRLGLVFAMLALVFAGTLNALPAHAAGSWVRGVPIGGSVGWLGTWIPYQGQPVPGLCIQADAVNPSAAVAVTPGQLTSQPGLQRPADLSVNVAQMAYIMKKWTPKSREFSNTDVDAAATALLAHVNFENSKFGAAASQKNVNEILAFAPANVKDRARQMVAEAKSKSIVGWKAGKPTTTDGMYGTINGILAHNGNGNPIGGIPFTITLKGPAVFDTTGTNTYKGVTASTAVNGIKWHSTGTGSASYVVKYDGIPAPVLGMAAPGGSNQTVIYDVSKVTAKTVESPTWDVIFDFQPQGTSQVVTQEVSDGIVRDTLTTSVDESYGNGKWVEVDGKPVTINYRASAYLAGSEKPAQSDTVPQGAQLIGTQIIAATGVDQTLEAAFDLPERGWVTWVWEVLKADQGDNAKFVHADWKDGYGLDAETSRENLPFRPSGTSNVDTAKKIDTGDTLTDTFTPEADGQYYDGQWTRLGTGSFDEGDYVPVTYRASVYFVSPTVLPDEAAAAPEDAQLVKTMTVVATEPGTVLSVDAGEAPENGFYTWVWEVRAEDQPEEYSKWIDAGWIDGYGVADETTSKRYDAQIDSTLSIRETKNGTYLVDDVWVTGMPENHPNFKGGAGFKADEAEISHELLFFPHGVEVIEANRDQAQKVGRTITIPAKNGFYPSLGETSWLAATDENGVLIPGTYVFVSTFAGDDRVKELTTSVEDVNEQHTILPQPAIETTLMYEGGRDAVPGHGLRTLVDEVAYSNLEPGKEYTLNGKLMDKETGEALLDAEGNEITSSAVFTPEAASGTVEVEFHVDALLFAGKTTVAFEELFHEGKSVAIHADIEDENQTIPFGPAPKVETTLMYEGGRDAVPGHGLRTLVDEVAYSNLEPGKEYTLNGKLMDKETGEALLDAEGNEITSSAVFTPEAASGTVEVEFHVDALLFAGKTTVAFEELFHKGKSVAIHADIEDENQTIPFGPAPSLKTTFTSEKGEKTLKPVAGVKLVDTVCDTNEALLPGTQYELKLKLFNKTRGEFYTQDGEELAITQSFTPETVADCAKVEATIDATGLANIELVAFEYIYDADGVLIGKHDDPDDSDQTVKFAAADNSGGGSSRDLARTGANVALFLGLATAAGGTGIGLVAFKRRHQ